VKTILAFILVALLLPACEKKKEAPPARPVSVSAVKARLEDAPLTVGGVGQVVALSTVSLQAQVSGVVQAVHFKEGDRVREGQLLATIDPAPFQAALDQARGNLARDWATADQAGRDYQRYKNLVAKDVVSQEDFEQRRTQMESGWQQVKADQGAVDQARINLGYCSIHSPVSGVAGYQLVKPGNAVNAYQGALVTINQVQPILVRFSVSEKDLAQVRAYWKDTPLAAEVTTAMEAGHAQEKGVLDAVDNAVDPQTGTISLQAKFENKSLALWPGQFVHARVTLAVEKERLTVPPEALLRRQDGSFVFVVGGDGAAELRPVKPGRTVDEHTVIVLEGLKAGETVITEGLIQVAPGAKVVLSKSGEGS
jgi:multidrug efflux system membrane fusion protein